MKKIFLAALVAVFGCVNQVFAQSQLATLFQNGDVKTFYGINALREAHSSAKHGDVITLSSGTFNSVDIKKAITLRGAGMQYDSIAKVEPTIIEGTFNIELPNDSVQGKNTLTMEGICNKDVIKINSPVYNAQFVKCNFWYIGSSTSSVASNNRDGLHNANFINCIVSGELKIGNYGSATVINSYINDPTKETYKVQFTNYDNTASFEFLNCVIHFITASPVSYSMYRNCVIYIGNGTADYVPSTSTVYNCIGTGTTKSIFKNVNGNGTNKDVASLSEIFKNWSGENYLSSFIKENLELTDAAKTKYLGTDGTQVGIYGGSIPFTARPSNPQITKLNVASKSTADGKLSVDIEVKAAE